MHSIIQVGKTLFHANNLHVEKHILAVFWDNSDYYRYFLNYLQIYNEEDDCLYYFKTFQVTIFLYTIYKK